MLEVMDMSAQIHIYIVMLAQNTVYPFFHIQAFRIILVCIRINRMVTHNQHPVFFGRCQYRIQPCQLLVHILLACIRILFRILTVFIQQRGCVNHYQAHRNIIVLQHLCVITCRHLPTGTHLTIIQYSLRITTIFMITQYRIPWNHQFRMAVHQFVVGHPQRIVYTAYAFKVMHIAGCYHCFNIYILCHLTHQFGDRFLVVISITAQIICQIKIQGFL